MSIACTKPIAGSIGIEFMHIQVPEEKSWLQERMETIHNQTHFTAKGKTLPFSTG